LSYRHTAAFHPHNILVWCVCVCVCMRVYIRTHTRAHVAAQNPRVYLDVAPARELVVVPARGTLGTLFKSVVTAHASARVHRVFTMRVHRVFTMRVPHTPPGMPPSRPPHTPTPHSRTHAPTAYPTSPTPPTHTHDRTQSTRGTQGGHKRRRLSNKRGLCLCLCLCPCQNGRPVGIRHCPRAHTHTPRAHAHKSTLSREAGPDCLAHTILLHTQLSCTHYSPRTALHTLSYTCCP